MYKHMYECTNISMNVWTKMCIYKHHVKISCPIFKWLNVSQSCYSSVRKVESPTITGDTYMYCIRAR